jgi:hypothetical protein
LHRVFSTRRILTLFFIPLIPLPETLSGYCAHCETKSRVPKSILSSEAALEPPSRDLEATTPPLITAGSSEAQRADDIATLPRDVTGVESLVSIEPPARRAAHRRRSVVVAALVPVVVVAATITALVATSSDSSGPSTSPILSPVTGCPRPLLSTKYHWCLGGEASELPFKMTIFTLKGSTAFVSAKNGSIAYGSKHIIGSDCPGTGVTDGSLVVPIFMSLNPNVNSGPTGGTSPVVFDFRTSGSFYTNPSGLLPGHANATTAEYVDYRTVTGWMCGTREFVGFGNKSTSMDSFEEVGYFIVSGYSAYRFKSYMVRHLQLDVMLRPPIFNPTSRSLYRGTVYQIASRVHHVFGPRTSKFGTNWSGRVDIQLLPSNYRAKVRKAAAP